MSTQNQLPLPEWVQGKIGDREPFWAKPIHLFRPASGPEYTHMMQTLRNGKTLLIEDVNMDVMIRPMPARMQKRRHHLQTFERPGWELVSFHSRVALFDNGLIECLSMREMAEKGFYPTPFIRIDALNYPIYQGTTLIDCFVPVPNSSASFTVLPSPSGTASRSDYIDSPN